MSYASIINSLKCHFYVKAATNLNWEPTIDVNNTASEKNIIQHFPAMVTILYFFSTQNI